MELLGKKDFLKKYNIDADKFDQSGIIWNDLAVIFNDYKTIVGDLEAIAQFTSHILNKSPRTHSTKYRVKSPEHLIEKIIRKTMEKNAEISFADYREKITDMVGVRVLHLFKEDWREIDRFIKDKFDVIEGPRAHIKEGDDDDSFAQNDCTIVRHSRGYRSVHYLVRAGLSKRQFIAEIQVRTIFEEGWSEIDHELKYPYIKNNLILERLLSILNNFAASADEMGSFINYIRSEFSKGQQVADELVDKIDKLNIDNYEKSVIKEGVDRIGNLFLPELKDEDVKRFETDIPEKYEEEPRIPPAPAAMADDELLPDAAKGLPERQIE
ncbi:MAG: hypothetical protein AAB906_01165, partial [Patescibacteria group bacterium]